LIFQFGERGKEKEERGRMEWQAGSGDSWERGEGSADSALSNCFNFYVKI
jgi:hypothetical protein